MKKKNILIVLLICGLLALTACTKKEEEKKSVYDLSGKTYYNTVDNYGHEDHSNIWFGKDGSFVLSDSYKDGYNEMSGKWTLSENVCTLDVESAKVGNYSKIIFEVQNDDALKLRTSLEGSKAEDLFTINEIKGSSVTPADSSSTPADSSSTPSENSSTKPSDTAPETKPEESSSETKPSETTPSTASIPCTGITSLYHNYWSYEGTKDWDLEIRPVPANTTDKITFKSADESVVKINDKGFASAVGVGKTTITATCGDQKLTVNYEVKDKTPKAVATTWVSNNPNSIKGGEPTIYFDGAGNFDFRENFYSGYGHYKGTYKIDGEYYYCTVTSTSFDNTVSPVNVSEIVFKIKGDNVLKFKSSVAMSQSGDLFYLVP